MKPFVIRPHLSESTFAFPIALHGVVTDEETESVYGEVYWRWADEPAMKWEYLGKAVAGHSLRAPFDTKGRDILLKLVSVTMDGQRSVSRIEEAAEAIFSSPARVYSGETDLEASEDLSPFDLVHIHEDSGSKVRRADASDATRPARAFVVEAAAGGSSLVGGSSVRLFFGGNIITKTGAGWTTGDVLYLSETPGGISTTPPVGATKISQVIGTAITSDTAIFEPDEPIVL